MIESNYEKLVHRYLRFAKNPEKFSIWRLEQLINFGLGKEKLDLDELRKYWGVARIDPFKRKFLSLLYESTPQFFSENQKNFQTSL